MVWLLDEEYDREHRAVHMTERGTDLHPLKIRYHGTPDIPYDERYTEFIRPTGLMPFISLVSRGGQKERVPAGASFTWIELTLHECPIEADEDTRRTYARVYLWYMISGTLFPDDGGKLAHWCWLKALTVLDARWSWGTAALAYLYRQLDEACRRTGSKTGSGGIGGCMLLLSVWSWDRLSVGRPSGTQRDPTWAYLWDNVSEMTSDPMIMYGQYTAELDTLTAERREEIRKTAEECEVVWEQSHTDEKLCVRPKEMQGA
ncbi:protein MAIN-LIKE 1-like [Lolium rigidum]|uniref:protein MAIN-LIKE 1-like n=1 Tax=Lolium rigidum TaxID=89674 RepID=UPI001F5C2DF4|nr:protein MAIN-LIKE 1-like [Lolium rigidum]